MTQYKLVPVEPTTDMLRSGMQRELADASHYGRLRDTYRAMLAAAPETPQPAKREPLSIMAKSVIGVKHFGNPIPQAWYEAAKELERAHGIGEQV